MKSRHFALLFLALNMQSIRSEVKMSLEAWSRPENDRTLVTKFEMPVKSGGKD